MLYIILSFYQPPSTILLDYCRSWDYCSVFFGYTGTWQTGGVFQADDWIKIPKGVPLNLAATLLVNPCTAYRMLKDFVPLEEGKLLFNALHYIIVILICLALHVHLLMSGPGSIPIDYMHFTLKRMGCLAQCAWIFIRQAPCIYSLHVTLPS